METPRPLKAIRLKCLDCSGWSFKEVELCSHKACVLWELRLGKKPKGLQYKTLTLEMYTKRIVCK